MLQYSHVWGGGRYPCVSERVGGTYITCVSLEIEDRAGPPSPFGTYIYLHVYIGMAHPCVN